MAKINRNDRRVLHALWPQMVMGPLRSVHSNVEYHTRLAFFGNGLTPGERKFVKQKMKELQDVINELDKIYFRLKR